MLEHYWQPSEKDISQYRKVASSLKKQIRALDNKLHKHAENYEEAENNGHFIEKYLPIGKLEQLTQKQHSKELASSYKREVMSDILKREKVQATHGMNLESNMFKNGSSAYFEKNMREEFHLPTLQKRNIFQKAHQNKNQNKPKFVKISKDRLIPVRAEDIKKKFQEKYHLKNSENNLR